MIVEFMGCPGAGKTTLARATAALLEGGRYRVRDRTDVGYSALLSLGYVLSAPFHLLAVLRNWSRYGPHFRATWAALADTAPNAFWAAARINAVLRLLSRHARYGRAGPEDVSILDDGALATAQLAFYGDRAPPPPLVERFVALAPLSEVIVWVDAPVDAMVERAMGRPDSPRELRRHRPTEIQARLAHVQRVYRSVAEAPRAQGRVIRAWNPTALPRERDLLAERVAHDIRRRLDACRA